jgi:hypothetical protein
MSFLRSGFWQEIATRSRWRTTFAACKPRLTSGSAPLRLGRSRGSEVRHICGLPAMCPREPWDCGSMVGAARAIIVYVARGSNR